MNLDQSMRNYLWTFAMSTLEFQCLIHVPYIYQLHVVHEMESVMNLG